MAQPTPLEQLYKTATQPRSISIGMPAATLTADHRFPLTPEGAERLVERGFRVLMEEGAAMPIHYSDEAYARRGVSICRRAQALQADVVISLSRLAASDVAMMRRGSMLLGFLYAEPGDARTLRTLLDRGITAIALENICDPTGLRPFADIIQEVAGRAAISLASSLLADAIHGKGILLGGIPGVVPCEVMVIGSDMAAIAAAGTAIGLGATVRIFDNDVYALRRALHVLGPGAIGSAIHPKVFEGALRSADIVVAAHSLSPDGIVDASLADGMKRGVICFDLTMHPGCAFPSLRLVDLNEAMPGDNPMGGPVRCCYINAGNAVPRTLAMALSNTFVSMLDEILVCDGTANALRLNSALRKGVYAFLGRCVNEQAAAILGIRAVDIDLLIQYC
ncbi:MAG: hypothetical protein K2L96_00625 [Muribaculaceae bacterium]|nr:hypothetical protein [Muribaculaceae bacterium]